MNKFSCFSFCELSGFKKFDRNTCYMLEGNCSYVVDAIPVFHVVVGHNVFLGVGGVSKH